MTYRKGRGEESKAISDLNVGKLDAFRGWLRG